MFSYTNPIIRGFNPDPSICCCGDDFYMTVSSFEYLPGLPIYHSKDMVHWEMIGHALSDAKQMEFAGSLDNGGIFAPTIRFHDGWFYIATTNVSRPGAMAPGGTGNFIIRTRDPKAQWSAPMWIDQNGIDPDLFFDDDGKVYFTSVANISENSVNKSATQMCEIDIETGEKKTPSRIVHYGCGGRFPEAPHVLKKDGLYYIMQAEGGTEGGHMETIARGENVWGPYTPCPHNPILTARDANVPPLYGMGHGDFVEDAKGQWWIVFLCYRLSAQYYHHLGRETAMAPVEWKDGWPIVNGGQMPVDHMNVSRDLLYLGYGNGIACDAAIPKMHTDFSKGIPLEWVNVRTYFKDYDVDDKGVTLWGNASTLSDRSTPAFFGRRQQDFECRMEIAMTFVPANDREEAGIVLMHRHDGHVEFVLTRRLGKPVILLRRRCADMVTEQMCEIPQEVMDTVSLRIIADRYDYEFYYKIGDGEYIKAGTAQTKLLSSEVVGGCMGTWVGIYASGNGEKCTSPACFHWFEYEILPEKPQRPLYGE